MSVFPTQFLDGIVTPEEQRRILVVNESNRILECQGYRLFLVSGLKLMAPSSTN